LSYIDTVGIERFVEEADRLAQNYGSRFLPSPWLRARAAAGQSFYPDTQAVSAEELAAA